MSKLEVTCHNQLILTITDIMCAPVDISQKAGVMISDHMTINYVGTNIPDSKIWPRIEIQSF